MQPLERQENVFCITRIDFFMIRIQDLKSIIVFLKSELFEHQYFASEDERLQIIFYEFFHSYVFPVDFFRIVLNNTTSYFAIF